MFINCLTFFDLSAIFECLMIILQMQLFIYMFLFIIIDCLMIYIYTFYCHLQLLQQCFSCSDRKRKLSVQKMKKNNNKCIRFGVQYIELQKMYISL